MTIGDKIKRIRSEKKWSQEDLAKKCNLNRNSIYKYEKNETMPRMPQIKALAAALNVSLDFLLGEGDKLPKSSITQQEFFDELERLKTIDNSPEFAQFVEVIKIQIEDKAEKSVQIALKKDNETVFSEISTLDFDKLIKCLRRIDNGWRFTVKVAPTSFTFTLAPGALEDPEFQKLLEKLMGGKSE